MRDMKKAPASNTWMNSHYYNPGGGPLSCRV